MASALLAVLILATILWSPDTVSASAAGEREAIGRLYLAAFDRDADADGLDYWHKVYSDGTGLDEIADYFVSSTEFQNTYGQVDHPGLVNLIYLNVLGRDAEAEGLDYWVGLLDDGFSPGTVLNGFAQSAEFIQVNAPVAVQFPASILMIGDSIFHGVRLLDIPVGSARLTFMTEEGRQVTALPDLLEQATDQGSLTTSEVIVIHLGTNGWKPEYDALFETELSALSATPVLLVNTRVARPWEAAANTGLEALAARHQHVELVDWHAAASAHPAWMRPDGVHPNTEGLTALAGLIEQRLIEIVKPAPTAKEGR